MLLALVALAMVLMVRGVTDPIDDELAGMRADLGSGDYDEQVSSVCVLSCVLFEHPTTCMVFLQVQRHTSKVSSGVKKARGPPIQSCMHARFGSRCL